MTESKEHT